MDDPVDRLNRLTHLAPDQISMASKQRIWWDNAVDLYRFPDSYLPAADQPAAAAVAG